MSRNIKKILKVLLAHDAKIFGTLSGSWFLEGTVLPDPPVESELNRLSVEQFNCTCNWWTVRNMVRQGFLEPTEREREYQLTERAQHYIEGREV